MLAGDADRERAVNVLKDAFAEGRLTQLEYEDRVMRAYQARTYGDLDVVTADIPPRVAPGPVPAAPPYGMVPAVVQPTNGTAVASLVCGICGFMTVGLTSLPAVILGHQARSTIRRTGQDGDGLATAGLVLGYLVLVGWALLILLLVAFG
ncbi:MAG: DUF1707 and DUF4190 domain-containing protein [Streptomyces sp.]|nr:DUF1707 and DUF4190 domain-containing protein [Streptomyces sp.]